MHGVTMKFPEIMFTSRRIPNNKNVYRPEEMIEGYTVQLLLS